MPQWAVCVVESSKCSPSRVCAVRLETEHFSRLPVTAWDQGKYPGKQSLGSGLSALVRGFGRTLEQPGLWGTTRSQGLERVLGVKDMLVSHT